MPNNTINFTINLNGNAHKGIIELDQALEGVISNAKSTQTRFDQFKKSALSFDVISNSIDKMTQGFQTLVGSSLEFEQQQANLKTLLNGDAEATDHLLTQIREYGKATVYDRSGLVEAQKTMMAFGLEAEFAFGKLKNIGDIALGDRDKMNSLALAFSQATSTGKLMGQDLLQMINAGFNPLEVISQKTGKSMAVLKEEMSKGAISADLLAQAFEWATQEGGRFYQGAETAAQTTAGRIAKMRDSIDEIKVTLFEVTGGFTAYAAEMGQIIAPIAQLYPLLQVMGHIAIWTGRHFKGLATTSIASVSAMTNVIAMKYTAARKVINQKVMAINKDLKGYNRMLLKVGIHTQVATAAIGKAFMRAVRPVRLACRSIGTAISSIPLIGWIVAAISAIAALTHFLWNKSEGFRKLVFGVWEVIKFIGQTIGTYIQGFIAGMISWGQNLWANIVNIGQSIGGFFQGIWNAVCTSFQEFVEWMNAKFQGSELWLQNKIVKPLMGIINPIKNVFMHIYNSIMGVVNKISGKIKEHLGPLIGLLKTIFNKGEEKGAASFQKDHPTSSQEETSVIQTQHQSILTPQNQDHFTPPSTTDITPGKLGASAGSSAGKSQSITIKLDKMVENLNFNGSLQENAHLVESQLREMLARILGMAATAV